jgi:hypothetical protein
MVDVVVRVASVDVAALEATGVGERHGVVSARGVHGEDVDSIKAVVKESEAEDDLVKKRHM